MPEEVWLTQDEMKDLCPSCASEMQAHKISKIKIMDAQGNFVFRKAGFSQGLCDRFGGATGFRTRCMSSMAGKVSDEGAFCNSLKVYCHGSAGAESKNQKILIKDEKQRYTLGIVYEPDSLDTDEEFASAEDIEKAAWDFMRFIQGRSEVAKAAIELVTELSDAVKTDDEVEIEVEDALEEFVKRGVNGMHVEDLEHCEIVESFIAPIDMTINGEKVKKGTWLAGVVWDQERFEKIESGEWNGYSMGGWAKKVEGD